VLLIPQRAAIESAPIATERTLLYPLSGNAEELWEVVDASRDHLSPWLPWVPFNDGPRSSKRYLDACVVDWDTGRAMRFAIRSRKDGALLGAITLDNCVHLHRCCDLGYWLRQDATGSGIMTEVGKATLRFAHQRVNIHRIRCAAAVDNFPSLRVIQRLGFRFDGLSRQAEYIQSRWVDHAVFGHLPDYD